MKGKLLTESEIQYVKFITQKSFALLVLKNCNCYYSNTELLKLIILIQLYTRW